MKCKFCKKSHDADHPHFKTVSQLTDKGFPVHDKRYKEAHRKANAKEKQMFGCKRFNELESYVRNEPMHRLLGKNTKSGEIKVSKDTPKKFRNEVAIHEKKESEVLKKSKKRNGNK